MPDDLDKYVDYAIAQAKAYAQQYKGTSRLAGKDTAETGEIEEFLATDPYGKENVRAAVKEIISETAKPATPAEEGKKPDIVFLAGALGSNKLLRDMADKNETQAGKEIKPALDSGVQSDFAKYKTALSKKLLDGKPVEPYGKWRGLLSGIDQSIQKMAADKKFTQVVDNTLAVSDKESAGMLTYLDTQAKQGNLRIYAVALTPEESKTEAKKLGLSEVEAEKTAHDFHRTFPELAHYMDDVMLVDKQGAVIFEKKDGKTLVSNGEKMAAWMAAFPKEKEKGGEEEIKPPPATPPAERPKKEHGGRE